MLFDSSIPFSSTTLFFFITTPKTATTPIIGSICESKVEMSSTEIIGRGTIHSGLINHQTVRVVKNRRGGPNQKAQSHQSALPECWPSAPAQTHLPSPPPTPFLPPPLFFFTITNKVITTTPKNHNNPNHNPTQNLPIKPLLPPTGFPLCNPNIKTPTLTTTSQILKIWKQYIRMILSVLISRCICNLKYTKTIFNLNI